MYRAGCQLLRLPVKKVLHGSVYFYRYLPLSICDNHIAEVQIYLNYAKKICCDERAMPFAQVGTICCALGTRRFMGCVRRELSEFSAYVAFAVMLRRRLSAPFYRVRGESAQHNVDVDVVVRGSLAYFYP